MAGLNFGSIGRGEGGFQVAGSQFDMDPDKVKYITHNITVAGTETIHTVPEGTNLYISKAIIVNGEGLTSIITLLFNDKVVYRESRGTDSTREYNFDMPLKLTGGQTIKVTIGTNSDINITIVGWTD